MAKTETQGEAYAKFVPEEVLTVKGQVTKKMSSNPDPTTVKLRLVTSVDSLKYSSVGFAISATGKEAREYDYTSVFSTAKIQEDVAGEEGTQTTVLTPSEVFCAASSYFAAIKIVGFQTTDDLTTKEINVTPYWVTKDGTKVYGCSRNRMLVSDERINDEDGTDDFTKENEVYTYENHEKSDTVSCRYFQGGSDTVYLKGIYTPNGTDNEFGITIRNGGEERRVLFHNAGILVVKQTADESGLVSGAADTYSDVKSGSGAYVWARKSSKKDGVLTADDSAVKTMLADTSSTEVIWVIEKNVLYCSVAGDVILRLPLHLLCEQWQEGRCYQLGVASYNTASNEGAADMTFGKTDLAFGKDAYGTENKPLILKDPGVMAVKTRMVYEPITGSYMSGHLDSGYAYGAQTPADTPVSISFDLSWLDVTSSASGAGISVRLGSDNADSRQIYFEYDGGKYQIRRQPGHVYGTTTSTDDTPRTNFSLKSKFYADPYGDLDKCNVTAFVYEGKLSVMLNGQTAYESALSGSDLFGDEYSADKSVSLGMAVWDSYNGQAQFRNVTFEEGTQVVAAKNRAWTFYPTNTNSYATLDTADGSASLTGNGKGWSTTNNRIELSGCSERWEITGTFTNGGNSQLMGITITSGSTCLMLLADYQGFARQISKDGKVTIPSAGTGIAYVFNTIGNTYDRNLYLFSCPGDFKKGVEDVAFKAVIADDVFYMWWNDKLSWKVPLTNEKMGTFPAGSQYSLALQFGENITTTTTQSFKNLSVRSGMETDDALAEAMATYRDFDWYSARNMMTLTPEGKMVTVNKESSKDQYIYSTADPSSTVYFRGVWEALSDEPFFYGVTLKGSDGNNRQVRFHNEGIALTKGNTFTALSDEGIGIYAYNTIKADNPYILAQDKDGTQVSPIKTMLKSKEGAKYQLVWTIRDNTLYCNVDGFTCMALPLNVICSAWTADSNITYQIGLSAWDVNKNGHVAVSDVKLLTGEAAEQVSEQ